MQIKGLFILIAGAILLMSCSPSDFLKSVGLAEDDDTVTPQSCTFALVPDFHLMNLKTSIATPEKMAVIVDGQLKYDECLEHPVITPAPFVYLLRLDGAIEVLVQHYGAYPVLPTSESYELLDRGDCLDNPKRFFVANRVPLKFKKTNYEKRDECGSYNEARVNLRQ